MAACSIPYCNLPPKLTIPPFLFAHPAPTTSPSCLLAKPLTIRVQCTSVLVRTLLKTSKCAEHSGLALICPTLCVFAALDLGPRSVFHLGPRSVFQSSQRLVERPPVAACAAARPPAADCAPPVREQGRRERAGSWGLVRLLARPHARHITWHEPAGRNVSRGEVKYRDSSMPIQECGAV